MAKKLSRKEISAKIADFKAAKKEILEMVSDKPKKPSIDDEAARINAKALYGVLCDSAAEQLKAMGYITALVSAQFESAIRNKPANDCPDSKGRMGKYHERFAKRVPNILEGVPVSKP